jgi:hypothetical protein
MPRDAEARIERALDHAVAMHLEHLRTGKPPSRPGARKRSSPALAANSSASPTASIVMATNFVAARTMGRSPAPAACQTEQSQTPAAQQQK